MAKLYWRLKHDGKWTYLACVEYVPTLHGDIPTRTITVIDEG